MGYSQDFKYVDAHFNRGGEDPRRWKRLLISQVQAEVINPSHNQNCFVSIQRFQDAVSPRDHDREFERLKKDWEKRVELAKANGLQVPPEPSKSESKPQLHYCGLFFDLDSKVKLSDPDNVHRSLAVALGPALKDAQAIANFFMQMGVEAPHIRVWFSGKKGFHITVQPDIFAIKPHVELTRIVKIACVYLKEHLGLTTFDQSVYTIPRQWRVPSSIHQDTGLFKTEISSASLFRLTTEEIVKMAKVAPTTDRPWYASVWGEEEYKNVRPVNDLVEWFTNFVDTYNHSRDLRNMRPLLPVIRTADPPACMQDLLNNGPKHPGTRNKATMAMAAWFRDTGHDYDQTASRLAEWTTKHNKNEGERELHKKLANMRSVLNTIFSDTAGHYQAACRFFWALSGDGPDEKIACVGIENCPSIPGDTPQRKVANQEPKDLAFIPLSEVVSSKYTGQKVKFAFHVSGKTQQPFIVPKQATASCRPDSENDMCINCPMFKKYKPEGSEEAKRTIAYSEKSRDLLSMIQCNDMQRKGALRHTFGIPARCNMHYIEVEEDAIIEELRLIPFIDSVELEAYDTPDVEDVDKEAREISKQHVVVQAFHLVDQTRGPIKVNRKYIGEGIPHANPRNQAATVLLSSYKPAQDDIDTFKMTKELHEKLKVFQVNKNKKQSVWEKFAEIHKDLESNVHRIWGRTEVAMAVDLSYHSVMRFKFQGETIAKGWVELLIIGDSGNGKTKLVKQLIRHYRLGEMTGAEGAKRTGLVWANVQVNGTMMLEWGKIPQNDGRVLVIDEFSGMSPEAIAEMTKLRSEGIAESQGINQQQTYARCRLIFLTNPREGTLLNNFTYGCMSVMTLFESHADARRIDLAVAVKSGDVPLEVINKKLGTSDVEHVFSQPLCRDLVLWAWSRGEDDIHIDEEATMAILNAATTLGKKYKCSVTLVTGEDQREKIARLAVAAACRVYSTDEGGHKVLVRKEHVDFVVALMQRCYDAPAMELNLFAAKEIAERTMSPEKERSLAKDFKQFRDFVEVAHWLVEAKYFRRRDLQEGVTYEKEEMDNLMRWMNKNRLLVNSPSGYKKSVPFADLLKKLQKNPTGNLGDEPNF